MKISQITWWSGLHRCLIRWSLLYVELSLFCLQTLLTFLHVEFCVLQKAAHHILYILPHIPGLGQACTITDHYWHIQDFWQNLGNVGFAWKFNNILSSTVLQIRLLAQEKTLYGKNYYYYRYCCCCHYCYLYWPVPVGPNIRMLVLSICISEVSFCFTTGVTGTVSDPDLWPSLFQVARMSRLRLLVWVFLCLSYTITSSNKIQHNMHIKYTSTLSKLIQFTSCKHLGKHFGSGELKILNVSTGDYDLRQTIAYTNRWFIEVYKRISNKRPTGLNSHLSIRDFTLNFCQKGAYLHINSPIIIIKIKINNCIGKQHHYPFTQ